MWNLQKFKDRHFKFTLDFSIIITSFLARNKLMEISYQFLENWTLFVYFCDEIEILVEDGAGRCNCREMQIKKQNQKLSVYLKEPNSPI